MLAIQASIDDDRSMSSARAAPHPASHPLKAMHEETADLSVPKPVPDAAAPPSTATQKPAETPGERLDPTRYGDWEKNGRCIDF